MTKPSDQIQFSDRIAHLSAEKRELLRQVLARQGADGRGPLATLSAAPPDELRITRDAVSGHEGEASGRQLYELFNRNLDRTAFAAHAVFLNLGYVENGNARFSQVELPKHCLNRNGMLLALEVIADVDLRGRDVADVGCGRGGTIALLKTNFAPRLVVGVDFSRTALAFCQRTHRYSDTFFVGGNAQQLPIPGGRFDVVTSIESASGYPDIDRFYREVARVLRPGGAFLYADVVQRDDLAARRHRFADLGLTTESERDISSNVLLSCDETAKTHRATVTGDHDEGVLGDFLGLPDSNVYRHLADGRLRYLIFKMKKDGRTGS